MTDISQQNDVVLYLVIHIQQVDQESGLNSCFLHSIHKNITIKNICVVFLKFGPYKFAFLKMYENPVEYIEAATKIHNGTHTC